MRTISKKAVNLPKTARRVASFTEPTEDRGGGVLLQVFQTKSRVYVRTDETYPEWRLSDIAEAEILVELAEERWEKFRSNQLRKRKIWGFIERAQELRMVWDNARRLDAQHDAIEEGFLRRLLRAATLDERIDLEQQRDGLLDAMYEANAWGDPIPDLPEGWAPLPFLPSKDQMSLII